jgi:site-specific DNA-cytosine methylase
LGKYNKGAIQMNVLSLFDGISCGQIALQRAGIQVDKYYASEIKPIAIKCAQDNFPNTIQLGDVRTLDGSKLPKINLLIGGSPCQDFSTLGKREGLNGKKSSLFYEYKRILDEVKPKYFLLENNANMQKEAKKIISDMLGVEPIEINSRLFVQQNRKRLYWTNINVEKPIQKEYKNILEQNREEIELIPYVKNKLPLFIKKYGYIPKMFNPYNLAEIKEVFPCVTTICNSQVSSSTVILYDDNKFSKLTPIEYERLQTLPDNFTRLGISNAQRCKCIGNGWTVDVIVHILKGLKEVEDEN